MSSTSSATSGKADSKTSASLPRLIVLVVDPRGSEAAFGTFEDAEGGWAATCGFVTFATCEATDKKSAIELFESKLRGDVKAAIEREVKQRLHDQEARNHLRGSSAESLRKRVDESHRIEAYILTSFEAFLSTGTEPKTWHWIDAAEVKSTSIEVSASIFNAG